jgi:hypothetical protein
MADLTVVTIPPVVLGGAPTVPVSGGGAGGNVGDLVYFDSTGRVNQANAAAVATAKAAGLIVAAAGSKAPTGWSLGDQLQMLRVGAVKGFAGLVPGNPYWVSATTAGRFTDTAPAGASSLVWPAGWALATDTMFIAPPNPVTVGAALTTLVDSTGGAASTTFAAITAGGAYAQADMVAAKNALSQVVVSINAIYAALRQLGAISQ